MNTHRTLTLPERSAPRPGVLIPFVSCRVLLSFSTMNCSVDTMNAQRPQRMSAPETRSRHKSYEMQHIQKETEPLSTVSAPLKYPHRACSIQSYLLAEKSSRREAPPPPVAAPLLLCQRVTFGVSSMLKIKRSGDRHICKACFT